MMLQRRKKPRRKAEGEIPSHRAWVRGFVCIVPNCDTGKRIEAAHCRAGIPNDGRGGTGLKPHDKWVFPCCAYHHAEQHRIGEKSFADKYNVEPIETAKQLWARSPHRPRD